MTTFKIALFGEEAGMKAYNTYLRSLQRGNIETPDSEIITLFTSQGPVSYLLKDNPSSEVDAGVCFASDNPMQTYSSVREFRRKHEKCRVVRIWKTSIWNTPDSDPVPEDYSMGQNHWSPLLFATRIILQDPDLRFLPDAPNVSEVPVF